MNWTYYTLGADGFLYDGKDVDVFDVTGNPMFFASVEQAEFYLETYDIRGTVV